MTKLLPLLAALALVGCAEEAAEVDPIAPAEVVTEPTDDMRVPDPLTDDGPTDDGMLDNEGMDDTTATM